MPRQIGCQLSHNVFANICQYLEPRCDETANVSVKISKVKF